MIEAIVCKSLDYKDSSKILYLYTEKGTMSIIARGVKKLQSINRFLSQVPNIIKFTPTRGDFPSLKEGELVKEFPNIQLDIESYTFTSHVLELVSATIDEENDHPKMFKFLKKLLTLFDQQFDPEILSFIFELKLLHFLGYGLRFKGCNICEENLNLVYSIRSGGLICRKHLEPFEEHFDSEIYSKIKDLYYMDISNLTVVELSRNQRIMIRHILDVTYSDFISYQSKSRSIIKQIKKY